MSVEAYAGSPSSAAGTNKETNKESNKEAKEAAVLPQSQSGKGRSRKLKPLSSTGLALAVFARQEAEPCVLMEGGVDCFQIHPCSHAHEHKWCTQIHNWQYREALNVSIKVKNLNGYSVNELAHMPVSAYAYVCDPPCGNIHMSQWRDAPQEVVDLYAQRYKQDEAVEGLCKPKQSPVLFHKSFFQNLATAKFQHPTLAAYAKALSHALYAHAVSLILPSEEVSYTFRTREDGKKQYMPTCRKGRTCHSGQTNCKLSHSLCTLHILGKCEKGDSCDWHHEMRMIPKSYAVPASKQGDPTPFLKKKGNLLVTLDQAVQLLILQDAGGEQLPTDLKSFGNLDPQIPQVVLFYLLDKMCEKTFGSLSTTKEWIVLDKLYKSVKISNHDEEWATLMTQRVKQQVRRLLIFAAIRFAAQTYPCTAEQMIKAIATCLPKLAARVEKECSEDCVVAPCVNCSCTIALVLLPPQDECKEIKQAVTGDVRNSQLVHDFEMQALSHTLFWRKPTLVRAPSAFDTYDLLPHRSPFSY